MSYPPASPAPLMGLLTEGGVSCRFVGPVTAKLCISAKLG